MKVTIKSLTKLIGNALSDEIFVRSQRNLSDKSFVAEEKTYPGPSGAPLTSSTKRKWSITNKNALKRSGYKMKTGELRWEIGYNIAYAYWVNYGQPRGRWKFEELYDWAWYRRRENDFPELSFPTKKNNPEFYKFYQRYKGKMISGHRLERKVFVFAYYNAIHIQRDGTDPDFFFSDAIYTTIKDKKRIIRDALVKGGLKVE